MKLRLRNNSIRLRITQGEMRQLVRERRLVETIHFGNEATFSYHLVSEPDIGRLRAEYRENHVSVYVPADVVDDWAATDRVAVQGEQATETDALKILLEKDFACLTPREGEDQADAFPNPATES